MHTKEDIDRSRWMMSDTSHVYPEDDLREHELSADCWCNPKQDDEHPKLYIHNSMDQRELYETDDPTEEEVKALYSRIASLEQQLKDCMAIGKEEEDIKNAYNAGLARASEIVLARVKDGEGDHIFQIRNANLTTAADAIRAEIDK